MSSEQRNDDSPRFLAHIVVAGVLLFLGVISVVNRLHWREPTDGVIWSQRNGLRALEVEAGGPAARAGVRAGDRLVAIDGLRIEAPDPALVEELLWNRQTGDQLNYEIERQGESFNAAVIVGGETVNNRPYFYLCFVGLAFLMVGVFARMRQREPIGDRFFWLAITFYALLVMSPTGVTDPWFNSIYWLDQTARNALPGLFLYFSLTFPRTPTRLAERRTSTLMAVLAPGALLWLANGLLVVGAPLVHLTPDRRYRLLEIASRLELIYIAAALAIGMLVFAHRYKSTPASLERKRLKWLVGGTALGFLPFIAIYVPLFLLGSNSWPMLDLAVLPLVFVPLSFGYAAVGFRLWDVEIILKRGLTYAVASLAVLLLYSGAQWGFARMFAGIDEGLVQTASLLATLVVAVLFAPMRSWVQELTDRIYYRERYRARRTLMAFGRELNSVIDLRQVIELLVRRVRETLGVAGVAVLLRDDDGTQLRLLRADGRLSGEGKSFSTSFSQFLTGALERRDFLYIDDLATLFEEFPHDREVLATEDLAYFLPMVVKGEVAGVLALGRTLSGDYLSSEDLKVLQPLASHAALAMENALLYREAEQRARELESLKTYNENIVESIKVGVMVLEPGGRVLSWNRSLEKLYGVSSAEAVGTNVEELFPERFIRLLVEARERVEQGQEPLVSVYRVPLRTRHSDDRVVTLAVARLLEERGPRGTVIIVDDVTERTELESQLRQAEKLASVGLLAAGVAHEVNTPLAGISGYVQMLQRKLPEADPRRAILEKIEAQTFRASQIVNNLLNFSRQETGDFRRVDLNEVINQTLVLAEVQLQKRGIHIVTNLEAGLKPIDGDPIKLQQVFMNLLLNARDAMLKGGDLRIATSQLNGEAIVEVEDSGTGIAPENLTKIYDPFFTTKGVGRGTGLGLSVSYGIVQEHRGSISVESTLGGGTSFRVALPVLEADAERVAS